MHLTQFSDYSLRLALYLACHPERVVSVDEVSRAFGISRHHLVKVVQTLTDLGVVEAQRGRGGGMRLAMRPSEINVGWLIRRTEPHLNLVECFDPATNTCPIAPACGLKGRSSARSKLSWASSTNTPWAISSRGRRNWSASWTTRYAERLVQAIDVPYADHFGGLAGRIVVLRGSIVNVERLLGSRSSAARFRDV